MGGLCLLLGRTTVSKFYNEVVGMDDGDEG